VQNHKSQKTRLVPESQKACKGVEDLKRTQRKGGGKKTLKWNIVNGKRLPKGKGDS